MIDSPFRKILPRYTTPLIQLYQKLGLTPNHVTVAGFILSLGASLAIAQGQSWQALALWWLGRLFDGTDGIYARATGQQSDFGGYLDITLDMASYGSMILGFALFHPSYGIYWSAILFLYVLCITTALAFGALQEKIGKNEVQNRSLHLASGLAEGGETGVAYSLFVIAPNFLDILLPLWIAVLAITVISRTLLAWDTLTENAEVSDADS